MKLDREARQYYDPGPTPIPDVAADSWEASFDDGDTWFQPSDVMNDRPRWLVAGPDVEKGDAVATIIDDTLRPRLRLAIPPELLVVDGPYIWLV